MPPTPGTGPIPPGAGAAGMGGLGGIGGAPPAIGGGMGGIIGGLGAPAPEGATITLTLVLWPLEPLTRPPMARLTLSALALTAPPDIRSGVLT